MGFITKLGHNHNKQSAGCQCPGKDDVVKITFSGITCCPSSTPGFDPCPDSTNETGGNWIPDGEYTLTNDTPSHTNWAYYPDKTGHPDTFIHAYCSCGHWGVSVWGRYEFTAFGTHMYFADQNDNYADDIENGDNPCFGGVVEETPYATGGSATISWTSS